LKLAGHPAVEQSCPQAKPPILLAIRWLYQSSDKTRISVAAFSAKKKTVKVIEIVILSLVEGKGKLSNQISSACIYMTYYVTETKLSAVKANGKVDISD